MFLELPELEVKALFTTQQADWTTFSEAAAATSVRLHEGALEYGTKFNTNLSLVARQDAEGFHVASNFLSLGKKEMYVQQTALTNRLVEINASSELTALERHLAVHTTEVSPWEEGLPVYAPRCFYPHVALEWGSLKLHNHHENMLLYKVVLAFYKLYPQGGVMDRQTALRLLASV